MRKKIFSPTRLDPLSSIAVCSSSEVSDDKDGAKYGVVVCVDGSVGCVDCYRARVRTVCDCVVSAVRCGLR